VLVVSRQTALDSALSYIGSLAQKIINDAKNKLEKQGINIH
jgi:hypothetical protein